MHTHNYINRHHNHEQIRLCLCDRDWAHTPSPDGIGQRLGEQWVNPRTGSHMMLHNLRVEAVFV